MHVTLNRRDFLRRAGSSALLLGLPVVSARSGVPEPQVEAQISYGQTGGDPLIRVFLGSASAEAGPRPRAWNYVEEVLRRGGLFFSSTSLPGLEQLPTRPPGIALLAGNFVLTASQREAVTSWVRNGGALIGLGGSSGLDELFGVTGASPISEGWIKVSAPEHPITSGFRSSLHVFGGVGLQKGPAVSLAELEGSSAAVKGSAIVENQYGKGRTLLIGPDLLFSIVHIQQGLPVFQDARPAADGSAPVNDGLLKAEDGSVLDWSRDRQPAEPNKGLIYLKPVTDELRELILRSILHLAKVQGIALPILWYWPRGLKAVAHMSHDTDGNEPAKANSLLKVMQGCEVKSTWCVLYPGGYPREFYRQLTAAQFEVALHYDALTGGARTSWSEQNFLLQRDWLLKEAGVDHITTNKNHYTRWESRLDFFRWAERAGLQSDQTRGPSKKGTIGFPLGGSQPYYPLDDESVSGRLLRVLEVNLLTQDLVITCPAEYGMQLVDSAWRHYGIGHFLFHPAHIEKPGVAQALEGLVAYARAKGMEWWTNRQIVEWETARRSVTCVYHRSGGFTFCKDGRLEGATLLFLKPGERLEIQVSGHPAPTRPWEAYGFNFEAVTTDIAGELEVRVA